MPEPDSSRRIRILREDVSRKIAAGEVIDRPLSIVRELLDNSLDAGAHSVDLYIEGGGLERVRVVDDGAGMPPEDLELCTERHATSKIETEEDLFRVATLGFRGEALASIAACSRLSITSAPPGAEAHRLTVEGGRRRALEPFPGNPGTVVDAADLFFNLPARKKFLKSPAAEAQACRQVFLDKALPHPRTSFRFFYDRSLKVFLPAQDLRERAAAAYALDPVHLYMAEAREAGSHIRVVAARPELARRDRRLIQVFVNRRRIYEFALLQAVEYAFEQYIAGGSFPIAFVFIEMDPALVDFNVHPAKREARFRTLPELRYGLIGALRQLLKAFDLRAVETGAAGAAASAQIAETAAVWKHPLVVEPGPAFPERKARPAEELRYRGQLFRLFLLVERGDALFIIDQHAAHERILFEELKARQHGSQELLMPIPLPGGASLESALASRREALKDMGIRVERTEEGEYAVTALPEELLCLEEELAEAILAGSASPEELRDRILSLAACRTAVKDGEELDQLTARELARRALELDNARCPHGRPIWMKISREELLRAVGRPL